MTTLTLSKSPLLARLPLAELLLLLTAIFWGTSYGVTKEALLYTGVLAFLVLRFTLTSFILLPFFWHEQVKGHNTQWKSAIPTGFILLCIFVAETYGIFHTTASNAAFLISLCVLMTPFIEGFVNKTWPTKSLLSFALMSVLGVLLLTQQESDQIVLNTGDYFILLAAFLRACMVVATKVLLNGKGLSALGVTCIQSNVVAIGSIAILLFSDVQLSTLFPNNTPFWGMTFYLVIFCTIFALFAQNYGVRHTSASKVALLTGSEPAFGALFAILWLGESLTLMQMIGGVCILAATLMASMKKD
ncbi:DMT family transporter [Marinomonas sp.]|nr:EamA family transporter [Marinomonas sp.]MDB4838048.1 DMT family transporter [Marinomonas sp.]